MTSITHSQTRTHFLFIHKDLIILFTHLLPCVQLKKNRRAYLYHGSFMQFKSTAIMTPGSALLNSHCLTDPDWAGKKKSLVRLGFLK